MSEEKPKRSGLGCWVKPLILAAVCLGGGVYMMDRWGTLSGAMKALSVLLVAFGGLMLLPLAGIIVFKIWMGRLKKSLEAAMDGLGDQLKKSAEETQRLYSTPQEYRPATDEDFEGLDTTFYDQTEEFFKGKGFRRLGDQVNKTIHEMGGPCTPIRGMVSSGGTVIVGIYNVVMGENSFKIVDIETEFSDGTFLTTANSAGLEFSTPPAQIERRQFTPDTPPATLLEAHETEMVKLTAAAPDRTCMAVQTLNELLEMQKRLHAVKNAARASQGYHDEAEVKRITEKTMREMGDEE